MPDPAISMGYGQAFIDRGWGRWGERPYTDVMAAVDGALERPDLDASRTALMGGSFGGYMANWVAGHTDRFRAIVTHASLWDLRGVPRHHRRRRPLGAGVRRPVRGPVALRGALPGRGASARSRRRCWSSTASSTRRVPISEALRLWTDLWRHGVDAKFLYFPDESHWILKPQNARLWYETVLAFLDQHVLGREWVRPALAVAAALPFGAAPGRPPSTLRHGPGTILGQRPRRRRRMIDPRR